MAERIFSIDFGSAYTKVALRRDPTADSSLLDCGAAEVSFCVPTIVAVDRRGTEPRLEFGDRAVDIKSGGGIDVYTNFKRDLFPTEPVEANQLPPLDALLQSEDFAALAVKYAVSATQVTALRQMAGTARALVGKSSAPAISVEVQRQENAGKLVFHFFRWLRREVLDACAKLPATGLKFEDIPVRVTVPALVPDSELAQHSGCKLLREMLHRAGWPLHTDRPVVTEPEANAVGILTKAGNVLTRRGRINLGEMFGKGPLITVLKGDPHHTTYRALVIDVGAFTTDFAALTIDTQGQPLDTSTGAGFAVRAHSVRFGAFDLDTLLRKALTGDKREWLERSSRKEFSAFQRNVFGEGKGYRVPGVGVIGGEADREPLQACLNEFGQQLAGAVTEFCSALEPASMQELILTGGGSSIPAVRDALIGATQTGTSAFVKTHAPDLKRGKPGAPPVDKLDETLTRGGSALGGASIYFEREYY